MRKNELFNKEVLDIDANIIGRVADIDIDSLQGVVNLFVMNANLTKKYVINRDKINIAGNKVILRIKADELK
jgi:sporulation protein YlmC with PRC-barrel domain